MAQDASRPTDTTGKGARSPTILVVEDETLTRIALADYLQEVGYRVLEAVNADEAVTILQRADLAVDLVFTDVRMPGSMNGLALARWIGAHRPGLAVILTSADSKQADVARELGAPAPFLAKPYDVGTAIAKIQAAIGRP